RDIGKVRSEQDALRVLDEPLAVHHIRKKSRQGHRRIEVKIGIILEHADEGGHLLEPEMRHDEPQSWEFSDHLFEVRGPAERGDVITVALGRMIFEVRPIATMNEDDAVIGLAYFIDRLHAWVFRRHPLHVAVKFQALETVVFKTTLKNLFF